MQPARDGFLLGNGGGDEVDRLQLRERLNQWRVFNQWEREHGDLPAGVDDLVRWYSDAWEFSRRYSPGWQDEGIDMGKVARIRRIREVFARLGSGDLAP